MKTKKVGYEGEGYLMVKVYDHPLLPDGTKIAQHRLKMINRIKRLLRKDEVVHHIDENITNNRIGNLQLMSAGAHSRLHHIDKHYHSEAQKQKWSNERRGKKLKGKILRERQASMRHAGMISAAKRKGKSISEEHRQKIQAGIQRYIAAHGTDAFKTSKPGKSKALLKKFSEAQKRNWVGNDARRKAAAENCREVGKRNKRRAT